jgi:hypothetical protein
MSLATEKQVQYQWLDDQIHEFVVLDFTRAGVDDFVERVAEVMLSPRAGAPFLVDSQRGTLPLSYMITRFRALNRTTPKPEKPFKIAIIQQSGFLSAIVQTIVSAFPQARLQFFNASQRDAALVWLKTP